ncbi:MAG: PEP-CTERM sorting domain-containing protein [Fimbriimonadaceae bacterium]|nr:PEP-CTERM sorting domain-containing protein [Fimbriimonadaceae bacterium]
MRFLIVVAATVLAESSLAGTWHQLASIPVPEGNCSANTMVYEGGDSIYATVGYVSLGGGSFRVSPEFYRYNIGSDTWTRLADALAPMEHNVAVTIHDGWIYMNRGNWANEFYRYEIAADAWQRPTWGPAPYGAGSTDGVDFYYTGGMWDQRMFRRQGASDFLPIADNPEPMAYNSMARADGKFYLTVGKKDGLSPSSHFYAFDPSTISWQRLADIPVTTYQHQLLDVGGGKLLLNTGVNSSDPLGLYEYTIASNSWTRVDDTPTVFHYARAVYDGSRYSYWRENNTNAFFRYDPVPEPATIVVLGLGALAVGRRRRVNRPASIPCQAVPESHPPVL